MLKKRKNLKEMRRAKKQDKKAKYKEQLPKEKVSQQHKV